MKVYVVEEYLNDYPENGGGFQGIVAIFNSKEKAEEYCNPSWILEDYGDTYYKWYEYEIK